MTDFDYFCPLKNLSHPVWAYDHIKMKIVWANGAAVELWSTKTNADLLQRDIILSLPESLRTKKEDQIEALKKGKSIVELWNISEEVPVKCKSTGHTLPDGRFIILVEGLSQSHHIISEDLRLLEGSRFTRARIAQFGLEGNLISQNPSSSKTFGHSSLEGRFSNREDYLEFIEKIKEKKYLTTEFLLDCLGEQKWFSLNAKIHNDPVTKKEVILVDFRDVAEKRKLQKKLELFYDNSPFGFAFCDMDGKLIEVNFAYCDILGYSNKQDVLDLTYWDLTPKKYKEQEEIQLHKLNTMGFYGPYRKEYIRQDGGLIDVELYGFIVENYEGVRGIWSIIQDVSKEKLFKDEIQTQKAMTYQQSQLALLGELSAGLGHEVNNPLSIISGSIELIYKLINKKEIDIERLRSLIDQSNTAVKRISDITAGMRVFTKIDQSKTKEFSVEDSLLETVELLNKIYSKEGVELKYNSSLEKRLVLKGSSFKNSTNLSQLIV
jgi:PAS domain S-box-containing protein